MFMNSAPEGAPYKSNTYRFLGLNRGNYTYNGELEDMTNMSTDEYPCAAPRGSREKVLELDTVPDAVAAPDISISDSVDGFTGVMGGKFYYNGVVKSGSYPLPSSYKWSIARYNTSYLINGYNDSSGVSLLYYYNAQTDKFSLPDNMMDDLILCAGSDSRGEFLCTFRFAYTNVSAYSCTLNDGTVIVGTEFFRKYNILSGANIFASRFKVGDEVSIEGFPSSSDNVGQVWLYNTNHEEVVPQSGDYSQNNTISPEDLPYDDIPDDAITVATVKSFRTEVTHVLGITSYISYIYFDLKNKDGDPAYFDNMTRTYQWLYCMGVKLSNRMRTFDNIAVHNNRLFGTSPNGAQIFGSSSTDIFDFSGTDLQTDELYYAYLPSTIPGKWTGLCEYEDVLLAFKDSSITVIYGDAAINYTTKLINGIGCIDPASIQCTPQGVIFLGYKGFYLYNGSRVPQLLSEKLYRSRYKSAFSGFDGNKYYAAAVMPDGTRELLTYDLRYRLWHKQDDKAFKGFFSFKGDFYLCDDEAVYKADSGSESVQWSFTTVKTHYNSLDQKDLQDIWIRADLSEGAYFIVATSSDGAEWKIHRGGGYSDEQTVFKIPVHIERGSTFRIKIYGSGFIVFREIEVNFPLAGRRNKVTKSEESELDEIPTPDYSKTQSDIILY